MKTLLLILTVIMALVLATGLTYGQTYQTGDPPISQPLVREGTLAVSLTGALGLGRTTSEEEAENTLSSAGVSPRNGWIADYPVTPDIAGEIRQSVAEAAASGSLNMGKDAALAASDGIMNQLGLALEPDSSGEAVDEASARDYPDPAAMDNYYAEQGPPVVTYYAPPAAYANLYSWVPYPFWWWNVRFPGFFVLVDFHRPFFFHGRLFFVSNHFFDRHRHAFVRVNARERFRDFDRFHDRFADRNRVVGPSTVRTKADLAFKRQHSGSFDKGSLERKNAGFGKNGSVPMMHNRTFDRETMSGRQVNMPVRTFNGTSRSFSPSFGGGRTRHM